MGVSSARASILPDRISSPLRVSPPGNKRGSQHVCRSRSSAVSNLIALYKALGGGWYSNQPLLDDATRQQMQQRTDWGDLLDDTQTPATAQDPQP